MENIRYIILFIILTIIFIKFKSRTIATIFAVTVVAATAGVCVYTYSNTMEKIATKVKGNVDEDVAQINNDNRYAIDTSNALETDAEIEYALMLENQK